MEFSPRLGTTCAVARAAKWGNPRVEPHCTTTADSVFVQITQLGRRLTIVIHLSNYIGRIGRVPVKQRAGWAQEGDACGARSGLPTPQSRGASGRSRQGGTERNCRHRDTLTLQNWGWVVKCPLGKGVGTVQKGVNTWRMTVTAKICQGARMIEKKWETKQG